MAAARRRSRGSRAAQSVSRLASGRAQGGAADGERPRPPAGGAADARARGPVPRTLGAGRGRARRGRDRARRVAISAPASRHGGDAALLRRIAGAHARALRRPVRPDRTRCERRRHRARSRRTAAPRIAPDLDCIGRPAGPGNRTGDRRVRHRHPAAARIRAAATDRARRRAAAARAAAGPAPAAPRRSPGLRTWRGGDRRADRLAGSGYEDRRDRRRRHRRAARRGGARRVAPDRIAEAAAAAGRHVALRPRESSPPSPRVEPPGRRARARPHGAPAPHGRARRSAVELAREPATRRAEPLSRERAARPGRWRARGAQGRHRHRHEALSDGPRPHRRRQRPAIRHDEIRDASAAPRRARVQPVVGDRPAEDQSRDGRASGSTERRGPRPGCRWKKASPNRCISSSETR